jgi:hypothetical protein
MNLTAFLIITATSNVCSSEILSEWLEKKHPNHDELELAIWSTKQLARSVEKLRTF